MMSLLSDVTMQLSLWGYKPSLWYLLSLSKNISSHFMSLFIYLFIWGFTSLSTLYRSYHEGSWKGRGNQYIQFVRVLYCKLQTNGKQLPAFPLQAMTGIKPRPQRWEARVLPLCHRGPHFMSWNWHKDNKEGDGYYFCFYFLFFLSIPWQSITKNYHAWFSPRSDL